MLANLDRVAASETFRAVQADMEMFGLGEVFPNLELRPPEEPSRLTRTELVPSQSG